MRLVRPLQVRDECLGDGQGAAPRRELEPLEGLPYGLLDSAIQGVHAGGDIGEDLGAGGVVALGGPGYKKHKRGRRQRRRGLESCSLELTKGKVAHA